MGAVRTVKRKPLTEAEKVELVIRKKAVAGLPLTVDQQNGLRRAAEVRR
jgi:hypothetical protein